MRKQNTSTKIGTFQKPLDKDILTWCNSNVEKIDILHELRN